MRLRPARLLVPVLGSISCLIVLSTGAEAQQPGKVPRIGYLSARPGAQEEILWPAFLQGLRELGYVEGKTLLIEQRHAPGQPERLRELAVELVRLNLDVIVVTSEVDVVKKLTTPIPIIFTVSADPVGEGLVDSLARPGGNLTGLSDFHGNLVAKRLEILKEAVPSASSIAFLWNSAVRSGPIQLKDLQAAAPKMGVSLLAIEVNQPEDYDRAFTEIRRKRPGGLIVHGTYAINIHRKRIFDFALKNRLPAIYSQGGWVVAGGLMSYGAHFPDLWRRTATYVDQILKGAKPADLPVEQPTKFELVLNLKTAKALGLTIPPALLLRADHVIE